MGKFEAYHAIKLNSTKNGKSDFVKCLKKNNANPSSVIEEKILLFESQNLAVEVLKGEFNFIASNKIKGNVLDSLKITNQNFIYTVQQIFISKDLTKDHLVIIRRNCKFLKNNK